MAAKSVFEIFKKEKQSVSISSGKVASIVFRLAFDDAGAYIEVQNDKGKSVEADYQQYSGPTRTILKSIQAIQQRSDYIVDWENPSDKTYLHEHEFLIEPLLQSKLWVTQDGTVIEALEAANSLKLSLTPSADGKSLASEVLLWMNNEVHTQFQFINEDHIFVNGGVVETAPIGSNFRTLPYFNTLVAPGDLTKFLSIFFSFTRNIELVYEDYNVVFSKEAIPTSPVLLFDKLDIDEALHMRVSQVLPGIDAGLLSDYELSAYTAINELEQLIEVKPIEQESNDMAIQAIEKMLQKHTAKQGKKKGGAEILLEDNLFIIPREIAAEFIYTDLPNLLSSYKILGAEKLKAYKITTVRPKLNLKLSHGIDFLEGDANLSFGNEQFSLFDALQQYNKNKYILLSDGTHAIVNESYMQKLQRLFTKKKNKVNVSFFDLPLVEELIDEKVAADSFKKSREVFEGFNTLGKGKGKTKLPKVNATLRPYQEQGYHWLQYLHSVKLGGCLADDMGLGKTLQTITLLASIYPKESTPTLIVMPKSLLFNWEKELKKFAPQLTSYTYYANNRVLEEAMEHNIILTTYAMVRNDIEKLKEETFYYAILDESQNIKNMAAQTSKAVMLLQCKHRLALSGTPIENNLGELYSLFRFLNPSMFGSIDNFNQYYLTPIQKNNDKDITADLRKKIYPFILRRLKKDVLKELPDKIEQTLYVEMSDAQKKLYEQRRQYYQEAIQQQIAMKGIQNTQFFVFQALSELRQLASTPEGLSNGTIPSPKIELLIEQVLDAVANKHKVLVFVNFLNALELIGEKLEEQGVEYVSMSGSTKNRQQLVERFQADSSCKVFLLTLKTGGTGLNLTAADMVFIFDPWWNKAAENQAIDRSHRFGQDKTVLTYKLITQGTIEEKILLLQEQKAEIFNSIISSDSASLKAISEDDIQFMLGV
ncbi:SNF2-related protein [Parasediminibacterium sp. JCM 36343]|uniref:DEAD/DEAH box helicase n=1 Tax=Parasediminibacterium sp. JCM 36343 TaxID=3374279 RepID=UPI003977F3BD